MLTYFFSPIATATDFVNIVIEPFSPGFVSGIVPEGDDDEGGGHDRGDGGGVEGDSLQGPEVLEHGRLFRGWF